MLIPRTCRLVPDAAGREKNHQVILDNPPERFRRYADWFYFLHVDPIQRFLHLVGMLLGTYLYYRSALALLAQCWTLGAALLAVGAFCFYGFGVISHQIYDRGAAKSDPRYWHVTLFTVLYINFATLFGLYQWTLRRFVRDYPFVVDEWDLVEMDWSMFLAHVLRLR